jgi:hypothetical protein
MLALARARGCEVVHADMTDFDLGRRFDGAVSLVSTVGVLGVGGLESHLAAKVVEDEHISAFWTVDGWCEAIAASPFTQVACHDGRQVGRPEVDLERGGGLLWHELVAP